MRFRRYIQGHRRGKDANQIEREAMKDPFLAEALEGYDRVKDDHISHIRIMRHQVKFHNNRRLNIFKYGSIAASLIFILGFGTYFLFQESKLPIEMISSETMQMYEEILPAPPPVPTGDVIAQNLEKNKKEKVVSSPEPQVRKRVIEPLEDSIETIAIEEDMALDENTIDIIEESEKQTIMTARARSTGIASQMPVPVIGEKAYKEYINNNLVKPTDDICREVKGNVTLTFHVNEQGKPYDITIQKSLCSTADQEAIRLIKEGPDWTFGTEEVKMDIEFRP